MNEKPSRFMSIKDLLPVIIVVIITLVVVGSLGYLSYQRHINISELGKVLTEKKEELSAAQKLLSSLEKLQKESYLYDQQILAFQSVVPPVYDERKTYELIRDVVSSHNVVMDSLIFKEKQDKENYYKFPIELRLQGQYGDIINSLEQIQGGEKIINITGITAESGGFGVVLINAQLETFSCP